MSLKENLSSDLRASMLAREELKTSVLRMLITSVKNYEIAKGGAGYSAADDEILGIIQKEIKQHLDSVESFRAGGREEMAKKEAAEIELLRAYLPAQLSEAEVKTLVQVTIAKLGATTIADMGKVMSALMAVTKGKADGALVSSLVKQELHG